MESTADATGAGRGRGPRGRPDGVPTPRPSTGSRRARRAGRVAPRPPPGRRHAAWAPASVARHPSSCTPGSTSDNTCRAGRWAGASSPRGRRNSHTARRRWWSERNAPSAGEPIPSVDPRLLVWRRRRRRLRPRDPTRRSSTGQHGRDLIGLLVQSEPPGD